MQGDLLKISSIFGNWKVGVGSGVDDAMYLQQAGHIFSVMIICCFQQTRKTSIQ